MATGGLCTSGISDSGDEAGLLLWERREWARAIPKPQAWPSTPVQHLGSLWEHLHRCLQGCTVVASGLQEGPGSLHFLRAPLY